MVAIEEGEHHIEIQSIVFYLQIHPEDASVLYKNTIHICSWMESCSRQASQTIMYSCIVSII